MEWNLLLVLVQETDIGRHVNGLRKHPSAEVKRLVKQLIRRTWTRTLMLNR
jgi:hypothetical protein